MSAVGSSEITRILKANPLITLNDGVKIPQLAYGCYKTPKTGIVHAIKVGYRHLDCARFYLNEKELGEAIRESKIDRNEFFVTSKLC